MCCTAAVEEELSLKDKVCKWLGGVCDFSMFPDDGESFLFPSQVQAIPTAAHTLLRWSHWCVPADVCGVLCCCDDLGHICNDIARRLANLGR